MSHLAWTLLCLQRWVKRQQQEADLDDNRGTGGRSGKKMEGGDRGLAQQCWDWAGERQPLWRRLRQPELSLWRQDRPDETGAISMRPGAGCFLAEGYSQVRPEEQMLARGGCPRHRVSEQDCTMVWGQVELLPNSPEVRTTARCGHIAPAARGKSPRS